jgi:puromycin-sensitive aminopeptidase
MKNTEVIKNKKIKPKPIRLSKDVVPVQYTITLAPDLEAHVFSGTETIDIQVKKNTKRITIHSKDLELFDVSVKQGKVSQQVIKITYDEKHESATLVFAQAIAVGKIKLTLSFRGILNDLMRGFYKSRYHADGKEHFMATTQFEANDARRCIPCFDEPAMKASFQVSLVIPNSKEAISNMLPTAVAEHSAGYKIVSFEKTPIMSTYLLAFLVGDFEYIEKTTKKGVKVRIITTPGKKTQGKFALDVTLKCLEYYEEYFDIPYPLNTLDMIAVPDFESGAMENWGAITYRETALLIDEDHSSLSNKQRVAIVICHELAHQWFGNLVTMEWWNDLWLNEGFASYMEYLAVDHIFPEWHIWSQFLFSDHDYALRLDGMVSTHPIEVPVHDPNDIGQIFDAISYSKGASVIRQLASYIGDTAFRDGLRYYLKKHSYKNTQTVHLWEAFKKTSKKDVIKIMNAWTKYPGYPLVSVIEQTTGVLTLSQKRFFSGVNIQKSNILWPLPITLVSDEGESKSYLLETKQITIHKPGLSWCKLNSQETGFYRVAYSQALLGDMKQAISSGRLSESDRYGIIRDVIALTETGEYTLTQAFDFIDCFKTEQSYSIWSELIVLFTKTAILLKGTPEEKNFKLFISQFMTPVLDFVGYIEDAREENNKTLLRSLVLATLIKYEDLRVLKWVTKKASEKKINPDIRAVVYGGMAKIGSDAYYKQLLKSYLATDQHQEKLRILSALGQFENEKYIQKNLRMLFGKDVRKQDSIYLFMSITSFESGRASAFAYMKNNWSEFKDISAARNMFSSFVKSFGGFRTDKDKKSVKAFFEKKGTVGIELALSQTLEKIDQNIAWIGKNKKEAVKYFEK